MTIHFYTLSAALLLILAIVAILYYVVFPVIGAFLFAKQLRPRKPKLEVPTTPQIGWWSHQKLLTIDRFEVNVLEGKLNLLNKSALLSYTITGTLAGENGWQPHIQRLHVAQRFSDGYQQIGQPSFSTDKMSDEAPHAIIDLTPIVSTKKQKNYTGKRIPFHFTNELPFTSFKWGENRIRFKCGMHWQDIVLHQSK